MRDLLRQFQAGLGLGMLFLHVGTGCSNDDETSRESSGSIDTCMRTCEKQADANCAEGPDRATCASVCAAIAADAECGSAYLAFTSCGATEAVFTCTSSGRLEMSGCWPKMQPYAVCAACRASSGDACGNCQATRCCAERKAYWGDPDQAAFFECLAGCVARDAGSACDCAERYPTVPRTLDAMLGCQRTRCAAECP
jgi:hypothetical protein